MHFEDFLLAHALILFYYGSVENAREHGAYDYMEKGKKLEAPQEPMAPKAVKVSAKQKAMEVTAMRAGPSGMSRQRKSSKKPTKTRRSVSPAQGKKPTVTRRSVSSAQGKKPTTSRRSVSPAHGQGKKLTFPNEGVPIGSGATIVPLEAYKKLRLQNYTFMTRSLLDALFEKSVLATSSVTGKRSPAFPNLPAKKQLDPIIVSDITDEVMKRYENVTRERIRHVMTTKCADEAKIARNLKMTKETGVLPKKRGRRSNRMVSEE